VSRTINDHWVCEGCDTCYAEYVNGCPKCSDKGLHFSVRQLNPPPDCPSCAALRGDLEKYKSEDDADYFDLLRAKEAAESELSALRQEITKLQTELNTLKQSK
jgi:hypothetical protein